MEVLSIRFPNLGIELRDVGSSVSIFGVSIAYYGMIMAVAMLLGYFVVSWQARRTNQNVELYLDFALIAIVVSVIGARIYYVIFNWSLYENNLLSIFDIRNGGIAIYGGVITGAIAAFIFTKTKQLDFWLFCDTAIFGLLTGQVFGRWGNFFNREAFGEYTDGVFAMQLLKDEVNQEAITQTMLNHVECIEGRQYIQVHPTFLYESLWNLGLLLVLLIYAKHKKVEGEILAFYLIGYGVCRLWIEQIRTDQLLLWGTTIPVSALISGIAIVIGSALVICRRRGIKLKK